MCLLHKDLDWGRFIRDEVANREDYFHALETCDECLQDYTRQLQAELQEPFHCPDHGKDSRKGPGKGGEDPCQAKTLLALPCGCMPDIVPL